VILIRFSVLDLWTFSHQSFAHPVRQMDHAPNDALDEPSVREKLLYRIVTCIDSAKNFRVRAVVLFAFLVVAKRF
jgi:hypothetical protein